MMGFGLRHNQKYSFDRLTFYVFFSVLYIVTLSFSASPGEDISISREWFLDRTPSDFLGTFAGLFYSLVPDFPFGWSRNLAFVQISLSMFSLFILFPIKSILNKPQTGFIFTVQYLVAVFSGQQSRDGTFLALMLFGLAIFKTLFSTPHGAFLKVIAGTTILTTALMFRPALSLALCLFLLFIFLFFKRKKEIPLSNSTMVIVCLFLLVAPTVLELKLSDRYAQTRSYPLQTILIHDIGFAACQSADPNTIERAIQALKVISIDDDFATRICQFYKINTWQAVIGEIQATSTTKNLEPPLDLASDSESFAKLSEGWINVLVQDPVTYAQAKLTFFVQTLFSSQTLIHPMSAAKDNLLLHQIIYNSLATLNNLLTLPWLILSKFHILSPFILLFVITVFSRFLYRRKIFGGIVFMLPLITLISIFANTILFVSDNARYVTPFALLSFVGLLLPKWEQ